MIQKTITLSLLFLIFFTGCGVQKKAVKNTSETKVSSFNNYLNAISTESLRTNLTYIASDETEGRETGSAGQKKAGKFMIDFYKKHGVAFPKGAKDYYQTVPAAFLNAKYNENLPDSENIWAYIEGSEKPNEIVVISAHYDHVGIKRGEIYNGADDDGSGTVALMEMAAAFQKAKNEGHGPKRSILIQEKSMAYTVRAIIRKIRCFL
jgi:acetylornithine deacetylase/succinyl-diaminopimelate desuccinylase-like protein